MRVLHVTDCYLPRLGGIELHVHDLAARQREGGDNVLVLTRTPAGPGHPDHPMQPSTGGAVQRIVRSPLTITDAEIRSAVQAFAPDVIQAHLSVASPFAWSVLRAVEGVPAVATMHSMVPDVPVALRAAMALTGFPARRVTMTAVSEAAAAPWRRALRDQPVRVLHNGIDPEAWSVPTRPHAGFTVVSVGRFARRKRHAALVGVMSRLRHRYPDLPVRLVLIGDGPELTTVRAAAHRAGLDDVIEFAGALSREAIRAALAGADAYVAPAVLESFGIAALEARCAGVPVVGMAASGVAEFVTHEREGLLATDDADLAGQLLRLITDPELCTSIRAHNTTAAPDMAWPAVLRRHEVTYELAGMPSAAIGRPGWRLGPTVATRVGSASSAASGAVTSTRR